MKTIILDEPGRLTRAETEPPKKLGEGEALVRVARVGICGSDLHAFQGNQPFFTYPRILGHELGVEVVDVGPNAHGIKQGDRCAVEPYLACGTCVPCRLGRSNCCETLQVLGVHTDGGMRESIAVPVSKLHKSTSLALEQLALVETLGIGAHAVARAALESAEPVLVIGAGPIGLAVIQFARVAGSRVFVLELSPSRREFCRREFRVEACFDARDEPLEKLRHALDGELPRVVFDATGNLQSMAKAFDYVSPAGRLVLVGLVVGDISFYDPEFHRRELTLLASRNALPAEFRRIVRLMEEGTVDTRPWVTHRASFDSLVEDFPGWLEPDSGVIKAMLEF